MTPAEMIAMLDRFLVENGQDIILRKAAGALDDVTVRAHVTPLRADELTEGISQDHEKVIVSPTEMMAVNWPSASAPAVPLKGHKAVIRGRARNIDFVKPMLRGGVLVRIELLVAG